MSRDLDYFMEHATEFDALSEAEKAAVFSGGTIGDTPPAADPAFADPAAASATPSADPDPAKQPEPKPVEQSADPKDATPNGGKEADPVVLAKDGKHTIPFSELESAREHGKNLEGVVASQKALIEQLQQKGQPAAEKPPAEPAKNDAPPAFDFDAKEAEYIEKVLDGDTKGALEVRKAINAEIQRQAQSNAQEAAQAGIQKASAQTEAERQIAASVEKALTDYPFLNDNEAALADTVAWRDMYINQGKAPHEAIALAAAKVAPLYRPAEQPKPTAPAKPAEDLAARAAAIVAGTKAPTPKSLSEVPAGSAAHHDEAAAILEMGSLQLMQKFQGKTPDQIMDLMNRVI